jgi:hypothetical protein
MEFEQESPIDYPAYEPIPDGLGFDIAAGFNEADERHVAVLATVSEIANAVRAHLNA